VSLRRRHYCFSGGGCISENSYGRVVKPPDLGEGSIQGTCGDLVGALERVRTKLAIAVAADSKITPLDQWRFYMETECRMRRCLKELRSLARLGAEPAASWCQARESLGRLRLGRDASTARDSIREICLSLHAIVEQLEIT
jgi:hypothetical protein